MPTPQLDVKTQPRERPTYEEMLWSQIQETKTEVRETRKELNSRMDRIERRMDKIEEEIKSTRQELNARLERLERKIDRLADKIDASCREKDYSPWRLSNYDISMLIIAVTIICALLFK